MQSLTLFTAGDSAGYERYRIPALCAGPHGTLLAFCEARRTVAQGDSGEIDIAVRRSVDGGHTWSPFEVVQSLDADTAGNPCPILDRRSGDVVLPSCRNRGTDSYPKIVAGEAPARRVYVKRLRPDGTWSGDTEITDEVKEPAWRWYATGPASAVVLTAGPYAGRIVVGCNHTRTPTRKDHTGAENRYAGQHLNYSDGGGQPGTWRIGAVSSDPDGVLNEDETALCVLGDGSTLYANARVGPGSQAPGFRADATSADGGVSYQTPMRPQASIVTSECQGSLLPLPDGRLVYAGPSLPGVDPLLLESLRGLGAPVQFRSARAAMALRVSDDQGRSWRYAYTVSGLPAAYSSMALVDTHTIGLLYETGDTTNYRRIDFERIPLSVLA